MKQEIIKDNTPRNVKKLIQVKSYWMDSYSSFTPDELIEKANSMKELGISRVGADGTDYSEGNLYFFEERVETDKEFQKRLKEEEKARKTHITFKQAIEKRDRALLVKLLKKYGTPKE